MRGVSAVFAQFRAMGYQIGSASRPTIPHDVLGPIFTPASTDNVQMQEDNLAGSDEVPSQWLSTLSPTLVVTFLL